jgi:hypothetical protein
MAIKDSCLLTPMSKDGIKREQNSRLADTGMLMDLWPLNNRHDSSLVLPFELHLVLLSGCFMTKDIFVLLTLMFSL